MGQVTSAIQSGMTHAAITFVVEAPTDGHVYEGIYFGESGVADIVDSAGTTVSVTVVAGLVYPIRCFGITSGGNTTITEGTAIGLG